MNSLERLEEQPESGKAKAETSVPPVSRSGHPSKGQSPVASQGQASDGGGLITRASPHGQGSTHGSAITAARIISGDHNFVAILQDLDATVRARTDNDEYYKKLGQGHLRQGPSTYDWLRIELRRLFVDHGGLPSLLTADLPYDDDSARGLMKAREWLGTVLAIVRSANGPSGQSVQSGGQGMISAEDRRALWEHAKLIDEYEAAQDRLIAPFRARHLKVWDSICPHVSLSAGRLSWMMAKPDQVCWDADPPKRPAAMAAALADYPAVADGLAKLEADERPSVDPFDSPRNLVRWIDERFWHPGTDLDQYREARGRALAFVPVAPSLRDELVARSDPIIGLQDLRTCFATLIVEPPAPMADAPTVPSIAPARETENTVWISIKEAELLATKLGCPCSMSVISRAATDERIVSKGSTDSGRTRREVELASFYRFLERKRKKNENDFRRD